MEIPSNSALKEDEINWMFCTQCKRTVVRNLSGICLHCQGAYDRLSQPDSWDNMHRCSHCGKQTAFMVDHCGLCNIEENDMFRAKVEESDGPAPLL